MVEVHRQLFTVLDQETNSCNFLDLKISIENKKILTDLYKKPSSVPQALLPSSSHPTHVTKNNIYSMAFRLLRICHSEELSKLRMTELKNETLLPQNYKSNLIDSQFQRICNLPGENYEEKRKLALEPKQSKGSKHKDRVVAPFTYSPFLPAVGRVFAKHHSNMIFQHPELQNTFPAPPMPALRQTPNLRHYLCRSRMYNVNSRRSRNTGWKRCNRSRCKNCDFTFDATTTVTAPATGYQHKITTPVTWKMEFMEFSVINKTARKYILENALAE